MKSIFSLEQIKYLRDNYDKKTYKELADDLGFTERQIRGKINGMGLTKLRKFDKHYFDTIDTISKAYWLGFIYADGYIIHNPQSRNYELGIEIIDSDNALLKLFNRDMGDVHTIQYRQRDIDFNGYQYTNHTCLLRIYSKEIVQALKQHNIVQAKTYSRIYPQQDKFFFHFLRGYFDGNGCISTNKHLQLHFTSANKDFLEYVQKNINELLNIHGYIYKHQEYKYRLAYYCKSDINTIMASIYMDKGEYYLHRKYKKYVDYYGSLN